jgi:hypothetical protein
MSVPETVQATLGDESVAARVDLGGEDALLVTPTRTIVYRAEGLLSDENIEEFPHDAEHVGVEEGRRTATITLDYGLDGERTFSVPTKRLDQVLHPVLAGVLNAAGVTESGETVKQTFRFSELTIVITSERLVRHIGPAVWDEEYESYHYGDVTDLDFEEGSVATSVVMTVDGRQERFKAPNDRARALREGLVSAVCAYHGVDDVDDLRAAAGGGEEDEDEEDTVSFGEGPTPLGETASEEVVDDPVDDATDDARTDAVEPDPERTQAADDDGFDDSGFESAGVVDDPAIARELAELREAVERQSERIDRQEETIRQLIEELRQGR